MRMVARVVLARAGVFVAGRHRYLDATSIAAGRAVGEAVTVAGHTA